MSFFTFELVLTAIKVDDILCSLQLAECVKHIPDLENSRFHKVHIVGVLELSVISHDLCL